MYYLYFNIFNFLEGLTTRSKLSKCISGVEAGSHLKVIIDLPVSFRVLH